MKLGNGTFTLSGTYVVTVSYPFVFITSSGRFPQTLPLQGLLTHLESVERVSDGDARHPADPSGHEIAPNHHSEDHAPLLFIMLKCKGETKLAGFLTDLPDKSKPALER